MKIELLSYFYIYIVIYNVTSYGHGIMIQQTSSYVIFCLSDMSEKKFIRNFYDFISAILILKALIFK